MLYSILIYASEGVIDRLPTEEKATLLNLHRSFQRGLNENGGFVAAQLMRSQTALTLHAPTSDTAKALTVDGPFSESKEQFVGFYLVNRDNIEAAHKTAEELLLPFVSLEIRPVEWLGGTLDPSE